MKASISLRTDFLIISVQELEELMANDEDLVQLYLTKYLPQHVHLSPTCIPAALRER